MDKNNLIERSDSEIIHKGEYINLRKDVLSRNGDVIAERDVVEHVGSIVAVPYEIIDKEIFFKLCSFAPLITMFLSIFLVAFSK